MSWDEDQRWERDWWGDCQNTLSEDLKQISYFKRLGLVESLPPLQKTRFVFDMEGKSVLDIGGGPSSFLLKCVNVKGSVVDPCIYPAWVYQRYHLAKIWVLQAKGEEVDNLHVDEVWIYNVLQHVEDPGRIIHNAMKMGKLIRFFDWIDAGVHPGHPHNLTAYQLNTWLGGVGTVEQIDENDAKGRCYYGVFDGNI